jgi:hypothetical protein
LLHATSGMITPSNRNLVVKATLSLARNIRSSNPSAF